MMQHRNYPAAAAPPGQRGAPAPLSHSRRGPMTGMTPAGTGAQGPGQPTQLQIQQQQENQLRMQQHAHHAMEQAKRRSQKPVDKNLPEGIDELTVGDGAGMYNSLRDVERKLDAIMMRKRLDVQDTMQSRPKRQGTMRVWISNTVGNQPWQESGMSHDAYDFNTGAEATYRVKIEGRLLDPPENSEGLGSPEGGKQEDEVKESSESNENNNDEPAAKRPRLSSSHSNSHGSTKTPSSKRTKLSHFFKSVNIDYDRTSTLQPDAFTSVQWSRPALHTDSVTDLPANQDFDCLEFERKSDESININVNLVRDEFPERYKLAQPLADLLDTAEADRKQVLMGLWEYIKTHGLQDESSTDSRRVRCDARLRDALGGTESLLFPNLPALLNSRNLLLDLPPISLPYTIRVDKEFHQDTMSDPNSETSVRPEATVYDIPVPLPDPLTTFQRQLAASSTSHTGSLQQISKIDDQLASTMLHLAQEKAKHSFFTAMSKDPANFIKRWVSSQKRDLDVILGAGAWGEEDVSEAVWRKGGEQGMWGTEEAREGVESYLMRLERPRPAPPAAQQT